MTTKQFIEKAIDGGYTFKNVTDFESSESHYSNVWYQGKTFDYLITEILLDPLVWQAVGKVEGWDKKHGNFDLKDYWEDDNLYWGYYMHRMIDALCEGRTIEQFLETL